MVGASARGDAWRTIYDESNGASEPVCENCRRVEAQIADATRGGAPIPMKDKDAD